MKRKLAILATIGMTFLTIGCPGSGGGGGGAALALLFGGGSSQAPSNPIEPPTETPQIQLFRDGSQIFNSGSSNLGSVVISTAGTPVTFTIKNYGIEKLDLLNPTAVAISGADAAMFAIVQPSDFSLELNETVNFTIQFNPNAVVGVKTAQISIPSNDPKTPMFQMTITGTASPVPVPEIAVSIASVDRATSATYTFTSVQEGLSGSDVTVTIRNLGTAALNVSNITLASGDTSQFSITPGTLPRSISAGGNSTFTMRFSPSSTGVKNAVLNILSNDSDEATFVLNLSGTGTAAPAPEINVQVSGVDIASGGSLAAFSSLRIGAGSTTRTITIQNVGNSTLNLTGTPRVLITGGNASDFEIVSQPSAATIASSASLTFTVRFTPTATGARASTFQIANNDSNEGTYTVNLSGTGIEPSSPCTPIVNTVTRTSNSGSQSLGGGVTLYWSGTQGLSVGPSTPSVVYFLNQPHSSPSGAVLGYMYDTDLNPLMNSRDSVGNTAMSGMLPYSRYSTDYLSIADGNQAIPTYTPSLSYLLLFEPNSTVSFASTTASLTTSLSCNPMLLEDQAFTSSEGTSSNNGLDKVWTYRKKLNVRLIFVNGTYATPTVAGVQAAVDRMTQVYAQNSVKIDLQFTATTITDAEFQTIADLDDDTGNVTASLTKLYTSPVGSAGQVATSLNIYLTADESQEGGVLGTSSGIPGLPGVAGSKKSGMIVFIEPHRSTEPGSGSAGDVLSNADLVFLGNTMAHEAGHFLGLFHVNERQGYEAGSTNILRARDPIRDTPYCSRSMAGIDGLVDISECLGTGFTNSGARNLMFWAGDGVTDQSQLTGEQGWLLRNNPLTY